MVPKYGYQMNRMSLLLLVFISLLSACKVKKEPSKLAQLEWLLGNWKGTVAEQPFYERWEKVSNTEFKNINYKLTASNDTIPDSRSRLVYTDNKIVYFGDDFSIDASSVTDREVIFENKTRGEKITFTLNEKNEWVATLEYEKEHVVYTLTKLAPGEK